jgi:Tol biopolymer transport system component
MSFQKITAVSTRATLACALIALPGLAAAQSDRSDFFSNYSPDGKKIVFVSRPLSSDNSLDLFTMNADGSDVKRIVSGIAVGSCPDGNCIGPSWGPKPKQ